MNAPCETTDLLVFSHLRWELLETKSQELLNQFAQYRRVFYIEEPILGIPDFPRLHLRQLSSGVQLVVPHIAKDSSAEETRSSLKGLIDDLIHDEDITHSTLWYHDPHAYKYTRHLNADAVLLERFDNSFEGITSTEKSLRSKAEPTVIFNLNEIPTLVASGVV